MNAKTKLSIAIFVSVIGFLLFVALGMATTFEPPARPAAQACAPAPS